MVKPVVFISYSHKDEKEKEQLVSHLKVLESSSLIEIWTDDKIEGGADWERAIKQAITQANVVILLITANFLTSKFILDKEVPDFLKRRKSEGLTVFPVIAKSCAWDTFDWVAKMNVRPKNGIPIWSGNTDQVDERLAAITREIRNIVKRETTQITDDTEELFSKATRFQIEGNLGEALELFKEVRRLNPSYPRIDMMIQAVDRELHNDYVDLFGRVISARLENSLYQVELKEQIHLIKKKLKTQRQDITEAYLVRSVLRRSDDVFIRTPRPTIAVVGASYTGKTSLINALYGEKLPQIDLVLKVQFKSGLVIYDTPGVGGDTKLENITRAFLGIKQLSKDVNGNYLSPIEEIPVADAHIYQQEVDGPKRLVKPDQIEKPDLIIFVHDIKIGIRKDDLLFFRDTVSSHHPVIVVVNKIDSVDTKFSEVTLSGLYQYFGRRVIPISAHKGWGFEELFASILHTLPLDCSRVLTETVNEKYKELVKNHQIEIDSIITAVNTAKLFDRTSETITDPFQYLSNVFGLYDLIRNQYLLSTQQLEKVGLDPDNVQRNLNGMLQDPANRLKVAVTILAFGRSLKKCFEALTQQTDVEKFDVIYEREFFCASDDLKPFLERVDTEIDYNENSLAQEILTRLFQTHLNE